MVKNQGQRTEGGQQTEGENTLQISEKPKTPGK